MSDLKKILGSLHSSNCSNSELIKLLNCDPLRVLLFNYLHDFSARFASENDHDLLSEEYNKTIGIEV